MPHDIFISHTHQDKLVAQAVCAVLERNGIRCWIAPRDVIPGKDFADEISQAIKGCRAMVIVFSGHTNESRHVRSEITSAFGKGKILVPLRIEEIVPAEGLDHFLCNVHWLDAFSPPLDMHLQRLADTLLRLLPERHQAKTTSPAALPVLPRSAPAPSASRPEAEPINPATTNTEARPASPVQSSQKVEERPTPGPRKLGIILGLVAVTGAGIGIYLIGQSGQTKEDRGQAIAPISSGSSAASGSTSAPAQPFITPPPPMAATGLPAARAGQGPAQHENPRPTPVIAAPPATSNPLLAANPPSASGSILATPSPDAQAKAIPQEMIITRARAVVGPEEKLAAVTSLELTGTVSDGRNQPLGQIILTFKKPGSGLSEMRFLYGNSVIQGSDGVRGWLLQIDQKNNQKFANLKPADEVQDIYDALENLYFYRGTERVPGADVTVDGQGQYHDALCWRVTFHYPDNIAYVRFFDCTTGKLRGSIALPAGTESIGENETIVSGIAFAQTLRIYNKQGQLTQTVKFDRILVNPPVDDHRFAAGANQPSTK